MCTVPMFITDASTGLVLVCRKTEVTEPRVTAATLSSLLLAGSPDELVAALKPKLGPLRPTDQLSAAEIRRMQAAGILLPSSAPVVSQQSCLTQRPVAAPKQRQMGEVLLSDDTQLVLEPLLEWELVVNLLSVAIALALGRDLIGAPGAKTLDQERRLVAVPLCHDPTYRLRTSAGVLDQTAQLPILTTLKRALKGLVTSSHTSEKHALELVCPDAPEERQLVLDSIDATLGRGRVSTEDNALKLRSDTATSRLWLAMVSGADIRLARCEECGRYFAAARHGSSPKTCSSSCRNRRHRAK